ncbi:High frequency lysogenization protein HflD like protein [Saliniradius amylolyticus]|uniref:High frequency lysogenization protein HflD homolog n=1 Tax=Saliniradius amylolyticus TaxID=2183582 RepID=A0A2S2E369_9ALTE|nr:high frequency lysogenization protein HflD [Saliniradius amylolyticus]AWL12095.1 High frequency lysogenization protein HflD like protein [Saliniradius amylolyticus]
MTEYNRDQCLALAGVCQAAALTQAFARKGDADEAALTGSMKSIIETDPSDTESVFGGIRGLHLGLKVLENQLSDRQAGKDAELTKYVASLLSLERKLSRQSKVMQALGQRIEQLKRQQTLYELLDETYLANFASVYSDVISPAGPKIQVGGSQPLLKKPNIQNRIRASLLAGIRAAVLWRQLGGKRRQILFHRRKIHACAAQALNQIPRSID